MMDSTNTMMMLMVYTMYRKKYYYIVHDIPLVTLFVQAYYPPPFPDIQDATQDLYTSYVMYCSV